MTTEEAGTLVATMKAAWERERISNERLRLYTSLLADMDYDEANQAVLHLISTAQFFPTVAEVRRCVAERRLGLPDTAAAWELAAAWAAWPVQYEPCTTCGGTGIRADVDPMDPPVCSDCRNEGRLLVPFALALPDAVRRAAELVGGKYGIQGSDNMGVTRSQFTKAYLQFREETVLAVQVPERLQLAAQARRAALVEADELLALPLPALPSMPGA